MKHRWEIISRLVMENDYKIISEIGVSRGDNVRAILKILYELRYKLDQFYLIDLPDHEKPECYHFDPNYIFKYHNKIISYLPVSSDKALSYIDDESLDFIFLDADHSQEGFINDVEKWWVKIRKGGMLCGDDLGGAVNHSCYYRNSYLSTKFGNQLHREPEIRLSEGQQLDLWWVYK